MLPSPLASTREPPASYHCCNATTAAVAPAVGDFPRASIAFSVGHSCVIRTSSVAAALAEASTLASVAFGYRASSLLSMSTRWIPPSLPKRSSPAGKFAAGLLFQLTMKPLAGLTTCGCLDDASSPFHSYLPLPSTGRSPLTPLGRTGNAPEV